jgi:hypothetical protein
MITVDKRKSRRLNVLYPGLISSENGDGISCEILNMSPFGDCLELGTSTEVPKNFVLVLEADHIRWPCRVAAPERFAKRQILLAPRAPSIHGPLRQILQRKRISAFGGKAAVTQTSRDVAV